MDTDPSITDAAEELSRLWTSLKNHRVSNHATQFVLGEWLGVKGDALLEVRLLGVIGTRVAKLKDLVAHSDHPLLADTYRAQLTASLGSMAEVIAPENSHKPWREVISEVHISEVSLVGSFSHIARSYQPLRTITAEEAAQLASLAENAIAELALDQELSPSLRELLRSALADVVFVVEHLPILGHELAASNILHLRDKGAFAEKVTATHEKKSPSLLAIANTIIFAMNLVAMPPHAEEFGRWYLDKASAIYQNFQVGRDANGKGRQTIPLLPSPIKREDDPPEVDKE